MKKDLESLKKEIEMYEQKHQKNELIEIPKFLIANYMAACSNNLAAKLSMSLYLITNNDFKSLALIINELDSFTLNNVFIYCLNIGKINLLISNINTIYNKKQIETILKQLDYELFVQISIEMITIINYNNQNENKYQSKNISLNNEKNVNKLQRKL